MKKFIKFCLTVASVVAVAAGVVYFIKQVLLKDCPEDPECDCDCDCDCDCEDNEDIVQEKKSSRKYVTIPVAGEEAAEEATEEASEEAATEEAVVEEPEVKKPAKKSRKKTTAKKEESEEN